MLDLETEQWLQTMQEERAEQARRVTAGYRIDELRLMRDQELWISMLEKKELSRRVEELEALLYKQRKDDSC